MNECQPERVFQFRVGDPLRYPCYSNTAELTGNGHSSVSSDAGDLAQCLLSVYQKHNLGFESC